MEAVKENILGTERIPKLMFKFGVPSMISMLVNSIYNLVDQIFIGRGVGMLGNGATNVTMPFVTIALAIAMLISAGSAANVGLNLGRKEQERADKTMANGFMLSIVTGIVIMIFGEIFLKQLLLFFGATEAILPYAIDYAGIYIIGLPMTTVSVMVQDQIKADGSPRYSMISLLVGCVFNIVFDPIFIFIFGWGVKGAALATIIGQFLSMIIALVYMLGGHMKTLNFRKENMKLEGNIVWPIFELGFSAFISQAAMLVMQIIMNNQAKKYGAMSIYGEDIPITVFGIVMRINSLMMSMLIGMCSGAAPVFSYNYGAKKYGRVRDLVKVALIVCSVIGVVGTLVFQFFPQQIVNIFGQEDELYNLFAVTALKAMTILIFIMAIQMTASTLFQAIGKPIRAMIIALSKQILFTIPCLYILPLVFSAAMGAENGILGVMYTFPTSDALAVVLSTVLLVIEMRNLSKQEKEQREIADI